LGDVKNDHRGAAILSRAPAMPPPFVSLGEYPNKKARNQWIANPGKA
jgi:hypothetical protein